MTSLRLPGHGGVVIAADAEGAEDAPPVLLLPGAGQTRHSWRRALPRIAALGFRAVAADLRGHGDSGWSEDGVYGYERLSADAACLIDALGGRAVLVGASLGGKIALATAGHAAADKVAALVVVDTAPRTRSEGIARVRDVLTPPDNGFASPDEAAEALARSKGERPEPGAGARLARNLRQGADGRWRWHWDPAFFTRNHGLGTGPALGYLEDAARQVTAPTLILYGEQSDVVDDHAVEQLRVLIPGARARKIMGVGHMTTGDANDAFTGALGEFLRELRVTPAGM